MDIDQASHAFVTGGASGIGLAIARALAARGVPVTIADINRDELSAAVAGMAGLRGEYLDIRDRAGWAAAKASAEAALGPVDILINNAGIAPVTAELADMTPESFDRAVAINLTGAFNGISAFAAGMRARGRGHIVNTASMSGMVADNIFVGSYTASKFGVVGMTEVLRQELAPHGVHVSLFCPGTTATPLMEHSAVLNGQPPASGFSLLDRPVQPAEVAEKVLRGIAENRAYILTHSERRAAVEARFAGIMAGFDAG